MDDADLPDEPPDWTSRLLDSVFVDEATIREPSASERQTNADRERRARELTDRLSAQDAEAVARGRRLRRRKLGRKAALGIVGVGSVFALGFVLMSTGQAPEDSAGGVPWHGDDATVLIDGRSGTSPTPGVGEQSAPLGTPPPLPVDSGRYDFMAMQRTGDRPVAYDPCRAIHYVVNAETTVPGSTELLEQAVLKISRATGLTFTNDGTTQERPVDKRASFQPDVYGDRWAPVVIWWSNPEKSPTLKGVVAGFAGSAYIEIPQTFGQPSSAYVTGSVVLDGPQLAELVSSTPSGEANARAVILHELGHLVGLNHVQDPTQVMNPEGSAGVVDLAAGDLRGLHELGLGECFPEI